MKALVTSFVEKQAASYPGVQRVAAASCFQMPFHDRFPRATEGCWPLRIAHVGAGTTGKNH